jgi:Tol biopolymer transport system component
MKRLGGVLVVLIGLAATGSLRVALQQPPPPAAAPQASAQQAPPDTEIYLAPLKVADGKIDVGPPVNITNSPGYDNQPFFTPDGAGVLFTSNRGGGGGSTASGANTQTDIYRYEIASKRISQVTHTPESEYSPTITPSGALSVVRVELDGNNTQRLWEFTADGRNPKVLLENVKPVGYHAWVDDKTVALFILGSNGQPATLQVADTRTGTARTLATDIGRSLQRVPGAGTTRPITFVQRERHGEMVHLTIKQVNAATGAIETLTPAVEGANEADLVWTPDGTLLMVKEGMLYGWKWGDSGWKDVTSLQRLGLTRVSRLAVSPRGNWIAFVASPTQSR